MSVIVRLAAVAFGALLVVGGMWIHWSLIAAGVVILVSAVATA